MTSSATLFWFECENPCRAPRHRSAFRSATPRIITILIIVVTTVSAAVAVRFWALTPLGFASYLTHTGASDADDVRQYWPHRLIQPEWVSATPDRLMNWHFAETLARLSVVAVLWFLTAGGATYRFIRRRNISPNKPDAANPAIASAFHAGRHWRGIADPGR